MSTTAPLSELDPLLASLNELKAPGANKSKIASITAICVKNIQEEQSIVQSFYRALKKAPATHKLGALYVIDSVIRQWTDRAKKAGQEVHVEGSGRGEPGTYAAALRRVAELMPALLHDTLKVIPSEQKPKLQNLVDIWDRGNFFPSKVIVDFKQKLADTTTQSAQVNGHTTNPSSVGFRPAIPTRPTQTPLGRPPQHLYDRGFLVAPGGMQQPQYVKSPVVQQQPPQPAANVDNILAALAASAPKPQAFAPPPAAVPMPTQAPSSAIPADFMAMLAQQAAPIQASAPPYGMLPTAAPPFNPAAFQPPAGFPGFPPPVAPQQQFAPAPAPQQDLLGPLRSILPANILNDHQKLMQALNLLQELQSGGVPMDQWVPVIQAFSEQSEKQAAPPIQNTRARSRSPDRRGRGRGSPQYENYDDSRNNDRARYRQRSPMRDSPMPVNGLAMNGNPMQPKVIIIDNTLPKDHIKVLSRTLFVGGANGTQQEIHTLFERFGRVQTCIANRDKRHAFVKMTTRQFALNAKAGMEQMQQQNDREVMNTARQTKWGVGFGPRECCDYARGESIIPIHKLTDADVKWLLSAEYGGTGGKELHGGMILEEPDIEIGAGVSSKAMSKRVGPDGSQMKGRQDKDRGGRRHNDRDRVHRGRGGGDDNHMGGMPMEAYGYTPRPEPVAVATPPAVPGFGFTLPGR